MSVCLSVSLSLQLDYSERDITDIFELRLSRTGPPMAPHRRRTYQCGIYKTYLENVWPGKARGWACLMTGLPALTSRLLGRAASPWSAPPGAASDGKNQKNISNIWVDIETMLARRPSELNGWDFSYPEEERCFAVLDDISISSLSLLYLISSNKCYLWWLIYHYVKTKKKSP